MKKSFLATTVLAASAIALCFLSFGCADKMTDRHSELGGGTQHNPPNVRDYKNNGTLANTNGMGKPLANGKINTTPDTMWNQNSSFEGKPF
ncbi:MAG TPA: hypothetical protein VFH95_14420 [Candidatus Kapabacteria bacterium]|nr:hypothetical protein [Candidatus Kapabacteria bacterium]